MGRDQKSSVLGCGQFKTNGVFSVVTLLGVFFIITACVGFYLFKSGPRAEPTLRFVSVIHRHGERAPSWIYPLNPYKDGKYWPEGLGSLLKKGKLSMFELGKFLRHRYDGFLSSEYRSAETLIISSDVDRCLMSAELVLAGLYPPVGIQIWNPELLWQPIPIHTYPSSADDMIRVSKPCAALSREHKHEQELYQKMLDETPELLAYLCQKTGIQKIKKISQIKDIYDNLLVEEQNGLALPEWTREVYPDKLKPLSTLFSLEKITTPQMTKLHSAGVFINEILTNMKQKADPANHFERRLNLYSAHDRTIVRLWQGMNITEELTDKPHYGASLFIELHEIKENYQVKILYKKGSFDDGLTVLKIKGCANDPGNNEDGMCDLKTFTSVLQSVAITDFEKECQI